MRESFLLWKPFITLFQFVSMPTKTTGEILYRERDYIAW